VRVIEVGGLNEFRIIEQSDAKDHHYSISLVQGEGAKDLWVALIWCRNGDLKKVSDPFVYNADLGGPIPHSVYDGLM
jgi:hypothetical protein